MSVAIDILKEQEKDQRDKLNALIQELKPVIEQGQRASNRVSAQERHLSEIVEAIQTLGEAEKRNEVVVPDEY